MPKDTALVSTLGLAAMLRKPASWNVFVVSLLLPRKNWSTAGNGLANVQINRPTSFVMPGNEMASGPRSFVPSAAATRNGCPLVSVNRDAWKVRPRVLGTRAKAVKVLVPLNFRLTSELDGKSGDS